MYNRPCQHDFTGVILMEDMYKSWLKRICSHITKLIGLDRKDDLN